MMNFEYILKRFDEEDKELQVEELTSLEKKGQDSNFYFILFYHFISIVMFNIIIECVIKLLENQEFPTDKFCRKFPMESA